MSKEFNIPEATPPDYEDLPEDYEGEFLHVRGCGLWHLLDVDCSAEENPRPPEYFSMRELKQLINAHEKDLRDRWREENA